MGKLVSWIAVGILLVVVPFGSWVYLSKGLAFRKVALSELVPKDSISIQQDSLKLFLNKTSLLVLKQNANTSDVLPKIEEQFKNTVGFQIIYLDTVRGKQSLPSGYLNDFIGKFDDRSFVLVDEKLKVRNSYSDDLQSVKKLVEHIAIVIPRPKEADIKNK